VRGTLHEQSLRRLPPHPKPSLRCGFDLSPQAGREVNEPRGVSLWRCRRGPRTPQAVLFACSQNAVRSPMAESLFAADVSQGAVCEIRRCQEGRARSRLRFAVMAELGQDISKHKPKTFAELEDWERSSTSDLIITLSPEGAPQGRWN